MLVSVEGGTRAVLRVHLLRVDLVVELEDVHDAGPDALQGEGGQVAILSAQHGH